MSRVGTPTERMLCLAAYVVDRSDGCSRADIERDVPGYRGLSTDALEKQLQRDRSVVQQSLGINIEWSEPAQLYRIHPPYFTEKERTALIAAAAVVDVRGIGDSLGTTELGGAIAQDAARIVVRVHPQVVDLRDAIAARRRVQFGYHGRGRDLDPYAIGMWHNRWYLVGHDHDAHEIRKYRLDRIETGPEDPAITATGEPGSYTIPEDFDAAAALRMDPNAWGTDPPLVARVRVSRDQVPMFLGELTGRVESNDANFAVIAVEVRDYESFVIRLLGFGTGVLLLDPPELVERMRAWLAPQVTGA